MNSIDEKDRIQTDQSQKVIPEGNYTSRLKSSGFCYSKNKNPIYELEFEILDDKYKGHFLTKKIPFTDKARNKTYNWRQCQGARMVLNKVRFKHRFAIMDFA